MRHATSNSFSLPSRKSRRRLTDFRRFVRRLFEPLEARWLLASDAYVELNLASNRPGTALVTDPSLGYAWGISASPGASGAFSVSDTLGERSNSYSGDVAGSPFVKNDQTVYVPLATGQVYNGNASEFIIHSQNPPPGGTAPVAGGPAEFLYASLDGTIFGSNASLGPHAVPAVSVPGAVFTGLTIANSGTGASSAAGDQLYAADFLGGKIDVFNASFRPVTTGGSFTDPNLPAGYKPFNVQALGGDLYVSYAASPIAPRAAAVPTPAPGGVVDAFDADGNFLGRIASGSPLDQPWGMALAPQSFGPFAGDLLVANHGDGKINVFSPTPSTTATTGTPLGTISGADGSPIVVDGLWGLSFGNGDNAGNAGSLYFTAGSIPELPTSLAGAAGGPAAPFEFPNLLIRGLVGTIQVAGTDPLVAVGTNTTAQAGEKFSGAVAAFGSADLPSPAANPLATYTATIDWGDGSSTSAGTVVPTGNGGFLVVGSHTYSTTGTDHYQVMIADTGGNSATATGTAQVTAAALVAHAVPVVSHQLAINNVAVASFVDTGGGDPLSNYTATIDWGDGSTSAGIVTNADPPTPLAVGFYSVAGSHTYTATGDYTLTITINDTDGSQATVDGSVDIVQATLLAHAVPVTSDGLVVSNATVADFIDTGGADPLTNYSATIDWGDGSTSTGTVGIAPPPGQVPISLELFSVEGSHTYAATGDYTFTVTIDDTDGSHATVHGTVDVAQATLVAHALPVRSDGLSVNNANVATFIDTGGADPLTNYTATIDWGDGSTSSGTVSSGPTPAGTPLGSDFLTIAGSHTYTATGDYTFTVTISDTDGSQATVQGTADVAQATLVAHALPVKSDGLAVSNANVAGFLDTGGADPLANYSATIDWGDGSTSAGTVSSGPTPADSPISIGFFTVAGSHTYTAPGDYTSTVTISDSDGSQATVHGTVD
ncbi:MAG TPA: TIGR03118 family protein, partial [Pirellulales bacterium]|nr:TIGR03118 family protein [Pirellulales bacterium]